MLQVEKTNMEIGLRTREKWYKIANTRKTKMVDGLAGRWKNGRNIDKVFEKYVYKRKRYGKRKTIWIRMEKQLSGWKPIYINLKRHYPIKSCNH